MCSVWLGNGQADCGREARRIAASWESAPAERPLTRGEAARERQWEWLAASLPAVRWAAHSAGVSVFIDSAWICSRMRSPSAA
jgi:hypothetical protein